MNFSTNHSDAKYYLTDRWRTMLMFPLQRLIYTAGTEKKRSHSESRGDHIGGDQNQQNSLGGTGGCSVIEVLRMFIIVIVIVEIKIIKIY